MSWEHIFLGILEKLLDCWGSVVFSHDDNVPNLLWCQKWVFVHQQFRSILEIVTVSYFMWTTVAKGTVVVVIFRLLNLR